MHISIVRNFGRLTFQAWWLTIVGLQANNVHTLEKLIMYTENQAHTNHLTFFFLPLHIPSLQHHTPQPTEKNLCLQTVRIVSNQPGQIIQFHGGFNLERKQSKLENTKTEKMAI